MEKEPVRKMSRYEKIKEQIAKLQKEKQGIENRQRAIKRQTQLRRLIGIGALTLKHLNLPEEMEPKEFEVFIQQVVVVPKQVVNDLKCAQVLPPMVHSCPQ